MELPPLPEPSIHRYYYCNKCGAIGTMGPKHYRSEDKSVCDYNAVDSGPFWNEDQMRAAISAAVAEEREACAVLCDQMKIAAIQTGHKEISMVPATLGIVIRARSNPTP